LQDKFKKAVYDKYGHDGLEKELTRERNGSKSQDLESHPTDPFENYTTDARTQVCFYVGEDAHETAFVWLGEFVGVGMGVVVGVVVCVHRTQSRLTFCRFEPRGSEIRTLWCSMMYEFEGAGMCVCVCVCVCVWEREGVRERRWG